MVGYSRMMAADETATLARLRALRVEVVDPQTAVHGGRIFKTTGDGLLAEFRSAVQGFAPITMLIATSEAAPMASAGSSSLAPRSAQGTTL